MADKLTGAAKGGGDYVDKGVEYGSKQAGFDVNNMSDSQKSAVEKGKDSVRDALGMSKDKGGSGGQGGGEGGGGQK